MVGVELGVVVGVELVVGEALPDEPALELLEPPPQPLASSAALPAMARVVAVDRKRTHTSVVALRAGL